MQFIAIHHTAVENKHTPQLLAVDRYHQGKWNMKSSLGWYVGYNFFCDVDGTTTQTRALDEETIANRGHNCDVPERCDTVSFCFAGNFNAHRPTSAQLASLERFITEQKTMYPDIEVVGHRDLQEGRTCPGGLIDPLDFAEWNSIRGNDPVDAEKQDQIKELQSQLDWLKILLRHIRDMLANR